MTTTNVTLLRDQLVDLEEQAGITSQMERARLGPFMPLTLIDSTASIEDEEADDFNYCRRKVRDIYFAVEDADLRRRLIEAHRDMNQACDRERLVAEAEAEAEQVVCDLEIAAPRLPWKSV